MPIGRSKEVVGLMRQYEVGSEETLLEVALAYGIGYNEIAEANPGVDPWIPKPGDRVMLPTRWVLPAVKRKGIVVNLAEMRLYYFGRMNGRRSVGTYPIGVGVEGFNTPLGTYRISNKMRKPSWFVPSSIREEIPNLPKVIPPGEDNPLGEYAMQLKGTGYFIHGTNSPFGIGRRVSHGCIRLYPEDIRELYSLARPGTPVRVIYQPVKVAFDRGEVYMEVHEDYMKRSGNLYKRAKTLLRKRGLLRKVDLELVRKAVKDALGYPVRVTRGSAPVMEAGTERESG